MPYIRGYFLNSRSDILIYTGAIKDILNNGFIPNSDIYPAENVLAAILKEIGYYKLNLIILALPLYMFFVTFLWYYILIREIYQDKTRSTILYISAIGLTLIPGGGFVHRTTALTFLVMILSILVSKKIKKNLKSLLVIPLFWVLVYWHPLSTLYTLLVILAFWFLDKTLRKTNHVPLLNISPLEYIIIIVMILWMIWYASFSIVAENAKIVIMSFFKLLLGNPYLVRHIETVEKYQLPMDTLLRLAFYRYGKILILGIVFILSVVKILKNKSKIDEDIDTKIAIYFASIVAMFSWLGIVNLGIYFLNFERVFKYITLFSAPLVGYILIFSKRHLTKTIISILLVVMISYHTVFTIHAGPLVGLENQQITRSEYLGWGWLFGNRDALPIYTGRPFDIKTFYSLIYGHEQLRRTLFPYKYIKNQLPPHLAYPEYIGEVIPQKAYVVTNTFMLLFYQSIIPDNPKMWKWTKQDYNRLNADPTCNLIYSSSGYWIYLTLPRRR
ncbi:hypothetical protein [Thermococcus sibiricus]|uniref:hypothetical protein n=1 Tax=Thermococcus sibiricus TaxID=172049 RepID=UPI0024B4F356|nr:hypothetical protein [Thermococcus sibiricus]